MPSVTPPPYLAALRDYLKREEADLWRWFSSTKFQAEYAENVRLDLLKGAYRLDRSSHGALHERADDVLRKLGLSIPATLYQAQLSRDLNASLVFLPGEGHLVFSGALLDTLTPDEAGWVIAHEFSHHLLLTLDDADFHTTDQILNALAGHRRTEPSHIHSCRLFRLYAEIFADRGALSVFPDPLLGVGALVKIETGLKDVSPAGYLAQAEEILSKEKASTREQTHPEAFIRARALKLWADQGAEAEPEIARLIEGRPSIDDLDLVAQERITALTRRIVARCLSRRAIRSESLLAHARLFFPDFAPSEAPPAAEDLASADPSVQSYVCHLLLDFAAADPQLQDVPLAAAIVESRGLGLEDKFLAIAARELKLKKKVLEKLKDDAEPLLAKTGGAP